MKYTTVLFDLDGTLLNTLHDIRDSLNHVLSAHGFPERALEEVRRDVGSGSRRLLERSLREGAAAPDFEALLGEYREYYLAHDRVRTAPYEGVTDMLSELSHRECKLAVVSNKPDASARALIRTFFGNYISVVIGESPKRRPKPAPDTVNAAMRELMSEKFETVYVGDSEVDIETAKAAGIPCISAAWGFRSAEQLRAAGAKKLIRSPRELLRLLSQ